MSDREPAPWTGPEWRVVANGCCAEGGYSVARDLTPESPHEFIVTTASEAEAGRIAYILNETEAFRKKVEELAKEFEEDPQLIDAAVISGSFRERVVIWDPRIRAVVANRLREILGGGSDALRGAVRHEPQAGIEARAGAD